MWQLDRYITVTRPTSFVVVRVAERLARLTLGAGRLVPYTGDQGFEFEGRP